MAKEAEPGAGGWINPWRVVGWGLAGALLLLPAVAMRFTSEVRWTASDFVVAGAIIGGIGLAFEFLARRARDNAYRMGAAAALGAAFLLIWINLAVGIIGSEDNPLNLVYAGVLLLALGGAIGAGFEAGGMARAMTAAAAAQALVTVLAAIAGRDEPPGMIGLIVLNGFFVGLFALAAWLFRRAQRKLSA